MRFSNIGQTDNRRIEKRSPSCRTGRSVVVVVLVVAVVFLVVEVLLEGLGRVCPLQHSLQDNSTEIERTPSFVTMSHNKKKIMMIKNMKKTDALSRKIFLSKPFGFPSEGGSILKGNNLLMWEQMHSF